MKKQPNKKPKKTNKTSKKTADKPRHISVKRRSILIVTSVFGGVLLATFVTVFILQTQGQVKAAVMGKRDSFAVDGSLKIRFNRQINSANPEIIPKVDGTWQESKQLFGVKELRFTPKGYFKADTNYKVMLEKAKKVLSGETEVNEVSFKTEKAPGVKSTSLDDFASDGQVIAMDQKIELTLSSRAVNLRDVKLSVTPEIKTERSSSDEQTFTWKYDNFLGPDTEYEFIFRDDIQKEELKRYKIKTAPVPSIKQPVKEHGITPNDALRIVFNETIATENRPEINFSLDGSGKWGSDDSYLFTPSKQVEPGKTYTYTLPKGLRTNHGGILNEPLERSFSTNGQVSVIGMSPRGYELAQGEQSIKVTFDQAVDHKSAEERFRVSAGQLNGFSWQGNTLIARVKNFGFQNTVTVSVEPGVRPVFGLPSASRPAWSFTTEARTVKLNVPYYSQVYAQSCEAASLRMALAYRGTHDSDWNILQKFGYNPKSRDKEKNIWDDPNKQFVGDVNGNQGAGTGWGVYAGPVSRAAGQYGRSTSIAYGANAGFVASQIHAGSPVIAWGIWGWGAKIESWKTDEGKTISGPIPMHVRLIVGVKGEPNNPLGFYVHDPIIGPTYWTRAQFASNTAAAGPAAQLLAIH